MNRRVKAILFTDCEFGDKYFFCTVQTFVLLVAAFCEPPGQPTFQVRDGVLRFSDSLKTSWLCTGERIGGPTRWLQSVLGIPDKRAFSGASVDLRVGKFLNPGLTTTGRKYSQLVIILGSWFLEFKVRGALCIVHTNQLQNLTVVKPRQSSLANSGFWDRIIDINCFQWIDSLPGQISDWGSWFTAEIEGSSKLLRVILAL
ncbi:hypothetical protein R3P38DRAFT_3366906 [Favolaschia claudopus]|uniref:Uncharacterized protein n=1 Tax=Favolaschia claudopus TaxID=2862362 RepID=A0AAW0AAI3_9AGAR